MQKHAEFLFSPDNTFKYPLYLKIWQIIVNIVVPLGSTNYFHYIKKKIMLIFYCL